VPTIPLPEPSLSDDQVRLRAFVESDTSAVAAAMEDGEISRWTATIPWPYSVADARSWILSHAQRRESGRGLDLAITTGGDALGAVGLEVEWRTRCGQIGYWMARAHRGRGFATRAVVLVASWALDSLQLQILQLFTMTDNTASQRVAAKAGFEVVEVIPDKDLGHKRADVSRWQTRRLGCS
jgi:RimJ/RimL family protein N-acetyltransferase